MRNDEQCAERLNNRPVYRNRVIDDLGLLESSDLSPDIVETRISLCCPFLNLRRHPSENDIAARVLPGLQRCLSDRDSTYRGRLQHPIENRLMTKDSGAIDMSTLGFQGYIGVNMPALAMLGAL